MEAFAAEDDNEAAGQSLKGQVGQYQWVTDSDGKAVSHQATQLCPHAPVAMLHSTICKSYPHNHMRVWFDVAESEYESDEEYQYHTTDSDRDDV